MVWPCHGLTAGGPFTLTPGEDGDMSKSNPIRGSRTALAAAALVVVTGGAVFGAIQVSRYTADAASTIHDVDQAIRAATIVRAHLALAALGSPEQVEISMEEAEIALAALDESLDHLEERETHAAAVASGRRFAEAAAAVMSGESSGGAQLDEAFEEVTAALDAARVQLASRIEASESRYALVGMMLGIATAGLAPLVMIFWARSVSRRSVELQEMALRLEHEAEIRQARSALLRTVVHEFRTPLTGISGLAAILEDPEVRQSSEAAEMVDMIRSEAEDLAHLTDDILTSARLETSQLEMRLDAFPISEAVEQVASMYERRGIEIEVNCPDRFVVADPMRLRQVIRNLVSNAVKYGGPEVGVVGRIEDSECVLEVIDDGDGVPEAIESRLFQPFPHQGTESGPAQSVGLGLAISRQLAEAMGGSLRYQRLDGLTVFELRLPLAGVANPRLTVDDPVETRA